MRDADPSPDSYRLSEAEHQRIFENRILHRFAEIQSVERPTVHFFGAQPGAGKTRAEARVAQELVAQDGLNTVLPIIGDDFRPYHPRFAELMHENDEIAARYTAADSGRWVEKTITHALQLRPHVLIEGTLRRPEVTEASARPFVESGFTAELHVLAVHEYVSRSRIFERYIQQLHASGHGRYTMKVDHDVSYGALPMSTEKLMTSGSFITTTLTGMDGEVLAVARADDEASQRALLAQLDEIRLTPPETNVLLGRLDQFSEVATALGKERMLRDVEELRREILG